MAEERFRRTGEESFFGDLVYDRVVPRNHFLRHLDAVIPWERFTETLVQYYKGGAQYGPPPYDPALILKMLLLSYLFQLDLRGTQDFVNYNLPAKCFVGLAVDEAAPDYSTLCLFTARLTKNGKTGAFAKLLDEIVAIAKEKGVAFGSVQIVDSVHVIANVNVAKDDTRKKSGKEPHDADAAWGVKHSHKVRDENGKEKKIKEYFYGYKQHVSMNAESRMITSVTDTAGNRYDGHEFQGLIRHDLEQGIPISIVTADKAYDDGENHSFLQDKRLHSAIRLNHYRTAKKDANKEPWVALKKTPEYQTGLKERYRVEAKLGEAKTEHGFRRCRSIGKVAFAVQGYLTALALNLKRLVFLLTGVRFSAGITVPSAA